MPEYISCDVPPVLSVDGLSLVCPVVDGAQVFTEEEISSLLFLDQPETNMDADFISFLAYTFCFFAMIFGFKAGQSR